MFLPIGNIFRYVFIHIIEIKEHKKNAQQNSFRSRKHTKHCWGFIVAYWLD